MISSYTDSYHSPPPHVHYQYFTGLCQTDLEGLISYLAHVDFSWCSSSSDIETLLANFKLII